MPINSRGSPARLLLVLFVLALLTSACGDNSAASDDGAPGGQELSGEIVISGSSTVEPISSANAQKFSAQYPDVRFSVDGPGTGDGFELFCNGETDISDASRPIDPEEEMPACKENGIEYIELKIGIDGIAVLTSHDNTEVGCLNLADLYALLGPESEGFDNWSDANSIGEELGSPHVPYPDAELTVVAPGEESGTFDSFVELVLEEPAVEERNQPEDGPFVRPDYQASPNDNVIIEGLSGNPTSLGWVGYAFYVQNEEAVRAIPIAEGNGDDCIEPNEETISAAEYPISRFLYIYVNAAKLENNPTLEGFVDFYVNEGITSVSEVGYVDLAEEDLQATREVWKNKQTGTREN